MLGDPRHPRNPTAVQDAIKPRGGDHWKLVNEVLACDEARRHAETEKQSLQSDRKRVSKEIGMLKGKGEDTSAIEDQVRLINAKIAAYDTEAEATAARQADLLLNIPNMPHADCPVGSDESANWSSANGAPSLDLTAPKDHAELASSTAWSTGMTAPVSPAQALSLIAARERNLSARSSISCWIPSPPTATRRSTSLTS